MQQLAKDFFSSIDLHTAGLEEVHLHLKNGNDEQAFSAYRTFLKYKLDLFDVEPLRPVFGASHVSDDIVIERADHLLENNISLLNGPLVNIGDPINWFATPENDAQWQSHLGYMYFPNCLVYAYQLTQESKYIDKWVKIALDFIHNHSLGVDGLQYDATKPMYLHEYDFGCGGEGRLPEYLGGTWIGLACAIRADQWISSLKALIHSDDLPDKVICELLQSIMTDHAYIMMTNPRRYVPNQFSHVSLTLTMLGILFHEFKQAASCYLIGMQSVETAVHELVLPDGSDPEQSFNYNTAIPNGFYKLLRLYNGSPTTRVKALIDRMEARIRFLVYMTNPLKQWPDLAKGHASEVIPLLFDLSEKYEMPETKQALVQLKQDQNPDHLLTSVPFHHGGYYVMRSGWRRKDMYLFFKSSRLAIGHMHEDCNSLVLTAHGRNMLIDSGNYNYAMDEESKRRNHYFFSSLSHNTVWVDGIGQRRLPLQVRGPGGKLDKLQQPIAKRWHSSDFFDFAEGEYTEGYGVQSFISGDRSVEAEVIPVKHEREIIFVKNLCWIVTDKMRSNQEHDYTMGWQFAAEYQKDQVITNDNEQRIHTADPAGANLCISQVSAIPMQYKLKSGESVPFAGWYAREYNEMTESVDIHCNWRGYGDQAVVSVLHPYPGEHDHVVVEKKILPTLETATMGIEITWDIDLKMLYLCNLKCGIIEYSALRVIGQSLLILTGPQEDSLRGIVLGCQEFYCEGIKVNKGSEKNFEFTMVNREVSIVQAF